MAEIKDRIIQLRNEKNLNQSQLADALEVSASSIGMYEQGRRKPSYELLEKISDYFNVDMDYLMGRSDIRNKFQFEKANSENQVDKSIEDLNLTDHEKDEYERIKGMSLLLFNKKSLSEESLKKLESVLTEIFIESLLKKRNDENKN